MSTQYHWAFLDPAGLLSRLNREPEDVRRRVADGLRAILIDAYDPAAVPIHPMRAVARGDDVDVRVAYLPHDWILVYEIHPNRVAVPTRAKVLVIRSFLTTGEALDWMSGDDE